MWDDRLSNQPTPIGSPPLGQHRSFSPLPRRSNHLAAGPSSRTGYSPRSSSLSLASGPNASTTSLSRPVASRMLNGSTLKHEITPPADISDPLDVLEKIIGSSFHRVESSNGVDPQIDETEKPDVLIEDVAFGNLGLHDFVRDSLDLEEIDTRDYKQGSIQSVAEYWNEKDKFEELHNSILACDNVLKSVEISLNSFQKDLGLVSAEIETLQSRSSALNTKLENRKIVEKLLGPAVEQVSISPAVVKTISEGPIDDSWLKALVELEKRLKATNTKSKESGSIRAITDIKPLLSDLTNKAVERIRDYFVAQIKAFRSPSINAQIIQQLALSKHKDLYGFLVKHHAQLAEEIAQAYVNTLRWYYINHFVRYRQALDKLSVHHVDKTDALGSDQSIQKPNKLPGARPSQAMQDTTNIGRRMDILKTSNQAAITSYLAEEDHSTHFIETPFRNFNLALIDNVSSEYSFLTEFFSSSTFPQMSRRFAEIFEPTFALGRSLVKDLIENSYDCLGILLCVRLNQHFAFELQRRKIPVADGYINGTNMLLWPRFQMAMDSHCESIRQLGTTVSGRTAASKLYFAGNLMDSSKQSTAPHYLTQRFGQFLYGILSVSYQAGDDEPTSNSLGRLRGEYEVFLAKASKGAGGDSRKRERFLANNYALVLTIIADTKGKLAKEQIQHFEGLKNSLET